MILLDNIIFSLQKSGGISTYWGEIIEKLINSNYEYKIFERNDSISNIVRKNIVIPESKICISKKKKLFIDRISTIDPKCNDDAIFHSSYFRNVSSKYRNNIKTILTIHDFIPEYFYTGIKLKLHTAQKKIALQNADKIITISNSTKRDLFKFHPWVDQDKVVTIYNGVSKKFNLINDIYDSNVKPKLLFVGSRANYKNFKQLVLILSKLSDFILIIVGTKLTTSEIDFLNVNLGKNWEFHNNINTSNLNILYSSSLALIYPSLYEGFGIPILEAMRCGCPVIALRNSSIPEVSGEAAVLLDSLTVDSLKNGLFEILNNRNKYVLNGLKHSLDFSWDKCFDETLKVYNSFL